MTTTTITTTRTVSLLGRLLAGRSLDELRVLRAEIASDIDTTGSTLKRLQTELQEVDAAIAERGQGQSNGRSPTRSQSPVPLRKAILTLLRERPGTWERDEILEELGRRGWAPGGKNPRNTLISRLSEMAGEGLIARQGSGFALTVGGLFPNEEEVPSM